VSAIKAAVGAFIGKKGIKEVYTVEVVVTDNDTVNLFIYKDGVLMNTDLSNDDQAFLREELQCVLDTMIDCPGKDGFGCTCGKCYGNEKWAVYLEDIHGEVLDTTEVDAKSEAEAQELGDTVFKESNEGYKKDGYPAGYAVVAYKNVLGGKDNE
jgi:hypothetical protein